MSQEAQYTGERNKQSTILETAKKIAETLDEPEVARLKWVVSYLGVDGALQVMEKTLKIEAEGGMLIKSGTRRRTPGGVFFYLVKEGLSEQERHDLLPYIGYKPSKQRKTERQPQRKRGQSRAYSKQMGTKAYEQLPMKERVQVAWDERRDTVKELLKSLPGEIDSMKIKLIGRPVNVTEEESFVKVVVYSSEQPPILAKELPSIAKVNLPYIVYILNKHWEAVSKAIQDEDDMLIIHGFLTYDLNIRKMAILALGVTTEFLLQTQKESQRIIAKEGTSEES